MLTEGGSPKLHSHSRNGRRSRCMMTGSSFGYFMVDWLARGPVRLKRTCTVTGMSRSIAAAQKRSSSGVGGVGDLEPEGLPGALGAAGAQIEEIGFEERLALDHLRVAAIRQVHRLRCAIAVFLRDPVRPALGRHFEMPVRRHQPVLPGHANPPDPRQARADVISIARTAKPSCPALCRASTPLFSWMAGTKPGHDEEEQVQAASCTSAP